MERGLLTREEFEEQKTALFVEERNSTPPVHSVSDAETSMGAGPAKIATDPPATPPTSGDRPAAAPGLPSQIGAYNIDALIGTGGMSAVYRGRHRSPEIATRQGGAVAIKILHIHLARNAAFRARFEREASLGLTLKHPGIVEVFDLVMDGGTLALVMELVQGRSLAQRIRDERVPMPWKSARPIVGQLFDAVAAAHRAGVIHRDLKPANVMLTPSGRLKVLDFGIARAVGGEQATATGTGMGTLGYMAPEQHTDAHSVDKRADVYALGMTLFEMLTGRLPWGSELDAVGVLQLKLTGTMPPVTHFQPSVPPIVADALAAALSADPAARPVDVGAFNRLLDPPAAPQPQPKPKPQPKPAPPVERRPPIKQQVERPQWTPMSQRQSEPTPPAPQHVPATPILRRPEPLLADEASGQKPALGWRIFKGCAHALVTLVAVVFAFFAAGITAADIWRSDEAGFAAAIPAAFIVLVVVGGGPYLIRAMARK